MHTGEPSRAAPGPTREELLAEVARLRRTIEEQREAFDLFRVLAEESPSMIFLYDLEEARLLYVNPRCEEALGLGAAELGRPGFDPLARVAPESQDAVRRSLETHLRGEDHLPFEFALLGPGGARIEAVLNSRLIAHRGRRAVLGAIADITARHRAEEELRRAKAELERQNAELRALDRLKDGLVRDVSHELKTPVAKQAMQIELLRTLLGEECRWRVGQNLQVMEESVHRQQRVIRNLLDLARLESGRQRYRVEPVRVADVVERVLADHRGSLEAAGFALERRVEPLAVLADGEMLWHVVANLVNNAVKFARPGAGRRLVVAAAREGDCAELRLEDNGVGLAEAELGRVFDRFFRAHASVEGSGVGLCICRSLVEGMGGTIAVASPGPGQGATVTVRLPLAPSAAP